MLVSPHRGVNSGSELTLVVVVVSSVTVVVSSEVFVSSVVEVVSMELPVFPIEEELEDSEE